MSTYYAPLRISIPGGAADVPDYLGYHTGSSIVCAINKYMEVTISTGKTNLPPGIDPPCPLIEQFLSKLPFNEYLNDLQILWKGKQFLGGGLGASAALLVAVAKHFFNHEWNQAYAVSVVEIENGSGFQDSAIAAWGGCRVFKYRYDRFSISQSLSLPDPNHFMLVDTLKRHDSQKQRSDRKQMALSDITSINEITDSTCVALSRNDYEQIGNNFHKIHQIKCQNPSYITDDMSWFMSECLRLGAYGGKLCGSGGGGHFLLVVDPEKKDKLRNVVAAYEYKEVPFNFENRSAIKPTYERRANLIANTDDIF